LGFKCVVHVSSSFLGKRLKARLVIRSFNQKHAIEYIHTYLSIARIGTIRLLIALAAIQKLVILQMDVKLAF